MLNSPKKRNPLEYRPALKDENGNYIFPNTAWEVPQGQDTPADIDAIYGNGSEKEYRT